MNIIEAVKKNVPQFVQGLYKQNGFFSYTQTSDLYSPEILWGLANTIFAIKTLAVTCSLPSSRQKQDIIQFINQFKLARGRYSDPLVLRKTRIFNKIVALKNWNFSNFFGQRTIAAETHQALVALILLGEKPDQPYTAIPYTRRELAVFLEQLHWKDMWGAASHVNHLLFFYTMNARYCSYKVAESRELIQTCLKRLEAVQNQTRGVWIKQDSSVRRIVNGAMKVVSGYNIIENPEIPSADKIIDYILGIQEDYYKDACDYLNAMYVLKYAFDSVGQNYKQAAVKSFCERAIDRYKKYYCPDEGGFMMVPNAEPRRWYGMRITKASKGADIHGTMLFSWAVTLAVKILGLSEDFQEIIN